MTPSTLNLITMLERDSYSLNTDIPVQIILENASSTALWVNGRMGMGYEDGLERELYMRVQTPDGRVLPVPDTERIDIHRLQPRLEDFRLLAPGERIGTTVNAATWYPFRQPGQFQMIFTYENRARGKHFNLEAFVGRVSATPLSVELR